MKDEAQLKAMGTADADAIASYYNLQIKTKTENKWRDSEQNFQNNNENLKILQIARGRNSSN